MIGQVFNNLIIQILRKQAIQIQKDLKAGKTNRSCATLSLTDRYARYCSNLLVMRNLSKPKPNRTDEP